MRALFKIARKIVIQAKIQACLTTLIRLIMTHLATPLTRTRKRVRCEWCLVRNKQKNFEMYVNSKGVVVGV